MRLIVAGGREFADYDLLCSKLNDMKIDEIVCGKARGADTLGERYAKEHNIQIAYFPADWDRFGQSAGYKRNYEMAKYATDLIAFWDGKSKGTKHMIDIASRYGLGTTVVRY